MGEWCKSGCVERDWSGGNIRDIVLNDGKVPGNEGNARKVEANPQSRDPGPGGHLSDQIEVGDVGANWDRRNGADGVGYDGRSCRMDGAMSSARRDSKRAKTQLLVAEDDASQHGHRKSTMADAPGPSSTPHTHPPEYLRPPQRRRRLKLRPTKVSRTHMHRQTYQRNRPCRGH